MSRPTLRRPRRGRGTRGTRCRTGGGQAARRRSGSLSREFCICVEHSQSEVVHGGPDNTPAEEVEALADQKERLLAIEESLARTRDILVGRVPRPNDSQ